MAKGLAVSQAAGEGGQELAGTSLAVGRGRLLVWQAGDLFIAGRVLASPPMTGHNALYKQARPSCPARGG